MSLCSNFQELYENRGASVSLICEPDISELKVLREGPKNLLFVPISLIILHFAEALVSSSENIGTPQRAADLDFRHLSQYFILRILASFHRYEVCCLTARTSSANK